MSDMSTGATVIGLSVSDVHLSLVPPKLRANEPDWLQTQRGYLDQLRALQSQYQVPIFYAGDICHHWNLPAELINFACKYLPKGYAIPGNHDLPFHRYEDRKRSAYWTLVEANVLHNLSPDRPEEIDRFVVHSFPWGYELKRLEKRSHSLAFDIAVVHRYVWTKSTGYEHAADDARLFHLKSDFGTYDFVVIGDNHIHWKSGSIVNNGCFMIRRADELSLQPSVSLLWDDRTITRYYLDVSKDVYAKDDDVKETKIDGDDYEFIKGLQKLANKQTDFVGTLMEALKQQGLNPGTKDAILQALEQKK